MLQNPDNFNTVAIESLYNLYPGIYVHKLIEVKAIYLLCVSVTLGTATSVCIRGNVLCIIQERRK